MNDKYHVGLIVSRLKQIFAIAPRKPRRLPCFRSDHGLSVQIEELTVDSIHRVINGATLKQKRIEQLLNLPRYNTKIRWLKPSFLGGSSSHLAAAPE